jgi:hypothetical protein
VALAGRGWYSHPGASAPLAPPRGGAPLVLEDGGDGRSDMQERWPETAIDPYTGDRMERRAMPAGRWYTLSGTDVE